VNNQFSLNYQEGLRLTPQSRKSQRVRWLRQPLSFRLLYVATLIVYFNFLRDAFGILWSPNLRLIAIVVGPAVMCLAAVVAVLEGQPAMLRPAYRWWLTLLTLTLVCLVISGAVVFENELRQIVLDSLLFPSVFAGILVGCRRENWVSFDRLLMVLLVVSVVVCALGMVDVVSAAEVLTRPDRAEFIGTGAHSIWGMPNVYSFWGQLSIWPYFVLTARDRSRAGRVTAYAATVLFFALAVIYQKRQPLVELGVFLGVTGLKVYSGRLRVLGSLLALALLVWSMVGISSAAEPGVFWARLRGRFSGGLMATLRENNRLNYDPVLVLTQFSTTEFVVGRGLGGTVRDVANNYPDELTHSLHNGMALMVLKGGVILLLVWFAGWLGVFADFMRRTDLRLLPYYLPLLMVFSMSWVFGFAFGGVNFVFLMMCAGRVMSKPTRCITTTQRFATARRKAS